mmetsp:Transcript_14945/g.23413  ORF Transcript_14945/g.23413 Transcript_14945/m.23413 type:complete len:177 (+) Transcript_14945:236-766(+)
MKIIKQNFTKSRFQWFFKALQKSSSEVIRQILLQHVAFQENNHNLIEGDFIALPFIESYFHFVFQTCLMLESLKIHKFLDNENITLLMFHSLPSPTNLAMLDVLDIPLPSTGIQGHAMKHYRTLSGDLIVPRYNDIHAHDDVMRSYNQMLLSSIRARTLKKFPPNPTRKIFLLRDS